MNCRHGLLVAFFAAVFFLSILPNAAWAEDGLQFESVKTKTFDKEKFRFPEDLKGRPVNVLFIAMSNDRESGEAQQLALLDWHAALENAGAFSDKSMPYHFIVMESPPFFVKGMITGAMRDVYEDKVPLNQSAVMFVDDLSAFATGAGIELDDDPTIVIAGQGGRPMARFKGQVSEEGVREIVAALNRYTGEAG